MENLKFTEIKINQVKFNKMKIKRALYSLDKEIENLRDLLNVENEFYRIDKEYKFKILLQKIEERETYLYYQNLFNQI